MSKPKLARRTGIEYGQTGDDLANVFFQSDQDGWYESSSDTNHNGSAAVSTAIDGRSFDVDAESINESSAQMTELRKRLEKQEMLVEELIAKVEVLEIEKNGARNLREKTDEENDDLHFDEWLAEWKAEEPEVFILEDEIRQEIAEYEKKYRFTSDELLKRMQEGTAPDTSDIMDWKILLELV